MLNRLPKKMRDVIYYTDNELTKMGFVTDKMGWGCIFVCPIHFNFELDDFIETELNGHLFHLHIAKEKEAQKVYFLVKSIHLQWGNKDIYSDYNFDEYGNAIGIGDPIGTEKITLSMPVTYYEYTNTSTYLNLKTICKLPQFNRVIELNEL